MFGLRKMPGPAASIALHALLFPSLAQVSEIGFVFVYACALMVALCPPLPPPPLSSSFFLSSFVQACVFPISGLLCLPLLGLGAREKPFV